MDEPERPVSGAERGNEVVGVRVVVRLAQTGEKEGDGIERQRRQPDSQDMRQNLESGADAEKGAQVQILRQGAIGKGGYKPTEESAGVAGPVVSTGSDVVGTDSQDGHHVRVDLVRADQIGDDRPQAPVIDTGDEE